MLTRVNLFKIIMTILLTITSFTIAVAGENVKSEGADDPVITSVPRSITYQGIMKDSGGSIVADSSFDITFALFDSDGGGTELWSDIVTVGTDGNGYFNAELENVNLPFDQDYWLELTIDAETLAPRQKLNMSAYAARADTADYALASAGGGANGWIDDGSTVRLETSSDQIGIGTSSPTHRVHITGSESNPLLFVEKTGGGRGMKVSTVSACAIWVENAGNHGLRVTQANGNGVNITNANNDGVHVDNAGNWAGYFNGKGYFGDSVGIGTISPDAPLHVEQASPGAWGTIYGHNTSSNTYGYLAGSGYGVFGAGNSAGMYGSHPGSGNFGMIGTEFYGVYGRSDEGTAGYFYGDVDVMDNLYVGDNITVVDSVDCSNLGTDSFSLFNSPSDGYVLTSDASGNGTWQPAGGGIPQGAIIMWSGTIASIPDGWALCDGSFGTPNLMDRFILSVGTSEEPGGLGGSDTHNHYISSRSVNSYGNTYEVQVQAGYGQWVALTPHDHEVVFPATVGNDATVQPPYYKLAFIMKL
ncbi:MAG: tail fiber protein [candidate division Zixibacteria bacterium]|nr:tail fiber protein [candidate division Zixibacteria bacterium]